MLPKGIANSSGYNTPDLAVNKMHLILANP